MNTRLQFRLRVMRGDDIAFGPGKIALLEAIAETGSMSAAGRKLGMSYRRAWMLVDEMNRCLRSPAVEKLAGGARGGGSALTPVGETIVRRYRAIESTALTAASRDLAALMRLIAP